MSIIKPHGHRKLFCIILFVILLFSSFILIVFPNDSQRFPNHSTSEISNNNSIFNNNVSSNSWHGIYLKSSSYNNINNNDAIDNVFGIRLQEATNNIISANNVSSNSFSGILLITL